ncbi:MAG: TonB-dependent receptor plug domain-containing protein [Gemmatimonadota bacterium]
MRRAACTRWLLLPVALLMVASFAARAAAQDPVPTPADSLADSLRARPDTIADSDRRMQEDLKQRVQLRPLPLSGTLDLLPDGARRVFTRDSIDWAPAQTLSDLLAQVAGVFVQRGGWLGRPELPNYQARGAAAIEYWLDGAPYIAIGPDSTAIDPSTFALSLLDRVEVERGPGLLRVFLFTRRHDRLAPRTRVGVAAGDRGITRYIGAFERRYPKGFGLSIGGDYFGVNAPAGGTGESNATNVWAQMGWVPTARFGVQAQLTAQIIDRSALLSGGPDGAQGDTISPVVKGTRTDLQLRGSWHKREDGLGPRLDLFALRTRWTSDSIRQDVGVVGGTAVWRAPKWSAQLNAWHHTEWTPLDARLSLGWAPWSRVSASIAAIEQHHSGDRRSSWREARVGVRLPYGVSVSGVARDGRRVEGPASADAAEQRFTDLQGLAAIEWRRIGLEAGYSRNDGWSPVAFRQFLLVPGLGSLPKTEWLTLRGRLSPLSWLTLESHLEHPLKGALPDGQPPKHAYTTATIQSRFLRNFPSGIFGMKVQAVVESWSPGVIGRDAGGEAIPLPGASFVRGLLEFKIGPFFAYYDRVNFRATKAGYVPGYPYLGLGSTFGVRWEFSN